MNTIFYLLCVACLIAEYKIYHNRLEQEKYQCAKLHKDLDNALMDIVILEEQLHKLKNGTKKK